MSISLIQEENENEIVGYLIKCKQFYKNGKLREKKNIIFLGEDFPKIQYIIEKLMIEEESWYINISPMNRENIRRLVTYERIAQNTLRSRNIDKFANKPLCSGPRGKITARLAPAFYKK